MQLTNLLALPPLLLALPTLAAPLPTALAQLLSIAPTSTTCASAPFPLECRTAEQAAPFLISAMAANSVYAPPELAALLALIAFESGDFKYSHTHFPGRPGQGTRNMQMPGFNLAYALSLPGTKDAAAKIAAGRQADALSDAEKDRVLALVEGDEFGWGGWRGFIIVSVGSMCIPP
ncbi:hypothetical protein VC83_04242 [Pseudogymnoascus destructans]|uniref:Uncharacterized protein n=2 Tax=Pseudogymnoascus destructans TaxID=655981 RepID=L8G479_PSED2|nr:uncharacterized protein VC83_04242 [Pseudogymnoascus destructans]ELR06776.1 hypothetical protein GMDG_02214 [Pseudogymnoascus destructans 20631-21]OAF59181.1 hypothetical protein VC83_04242 [Pseudogymnoascus destructans]